MPLAAKRFSAAQGATGTDNECKWYHCDEPASVPVPLAS